MGEGGADRSQETWGFQKAIAGTDKKGSLAKIAGVFFSLSVKSEKIVIL